MKTLRPDTFLLPIAVFVTLSTTLVSATLATIIQMDKDLIAAESGTQLADSSSQSQSDRHGRFAEVTRCQVP
jgi:hypothetical protein